ncbi:Orf y [Tanacetum coccineum]|uniref:TPA: Orf y n=1 Tax=Tanacetum coccineum TaxID=301880 RepID=A0ABQ5B919_9ASTR
MTSRRPSILNRSSTKCRTSDLKKTKSVAWLDTANGPEQTSSLARTTRSSDFESSLGEIMIRLLRTPPERSRLSNTSYMGFQYSVENVVDHLTKQALNSNSSVNEVSIEELEGMSWHLKPPEQTSVRVPSRVAVNERLNRSVSLRFERYRQTPQPPRYSVDQHDREVIGNDNLDEDEEHFIGICLQAPQEEHISYDVCFCESCLNEAMILEEEPLNKVRRSNKPKRSKQRSSEKWSTLGLPITLVYRNVQVAALAKELWICIFVSAIPIPGYYKITGRNRKIEKIQNIQRNADIFSIETISRENYKAIEDDVKTVYQELDLDDNWDIVSADFDDSSVYSISEGEGDTYQSISVMVQDTPIEETVFMAIEVDESDDDLEEEDNQFGHHAFMFHPGPPTKIAEMVQSVGSWKPDKELPVKSKECEHEWNENTVTNYTICYFCGILTTDTSRLNCPKCQLTTCALCARNYLGKTVNVKRKQPQKQEEEKDFNKVNEVKLHSKTFGKKRKDQESLEELRLEKEKLEEQKDEEIRELKAQLQKKKEEEEVQFSKEEFPPLGNIHVAKPCVETEIHYFGNATASPKVRKVTNQLYNVKVEFDIPNCTAFGTTAIIDTGASACCINKRVIPEEALEPLTQTVVKKARGTTVDPVTGREVKGKERMVFNYKSLNDSTYKDQYSLPGINTIIKRIGGAKIFSKFDLKSGFHQVAMDEESIPWTAFLVPGGLYEWLVMPFGLKERLGCIQRKMDKCFKGTEFISIAITGLLVYSPTKMKIAVSKSGFLRSSHRRRNNKAATTYHKEDYGCMEGWGGIVKWKKSKEDPKSSEKICAYASGKFSTTQSTIDAEINACINTLEKLKIYYIDKKKMHWRNEGISSCSSLSVEEVLQYPYNNLEKEYGTTAKNSRPTHNPNKKWYKSDAGDQSAQDMNLLAAKEALKPCGYTYKQPYNSKAKSDREIIQR